MLIETSAILAILRDEPEANLLLDQLESHPDRITTVTAMVEASIALGRFDRDYAAATASVAKLAQRIGIRVEAVSADLFAGTMQAYLRYGKGTGHPAQLNFGDCFSYAAAKKAGVPLLYKGEDFARTDLA